MAEDPSDIREAIGQTREELADTIQALGDKADVKAQAGRKVDQLRNRGSGMADELRSHRNLVAAGLGLIVLVVIRRRRRRGAS